MAASVSTSAVTGARSARGASSVRKSATPIARGAASASAISDVIAVPNRKLAAPNASFPMTGFQAMRVMKCRPNFVTDGQAPSISFHVMSPTRTTAAAAAAPAIPWRTRSPKRTRRPAKGRRASSGVMSAADTAVLAVDLGDRLLGDDQHRLRNRYEAKRGRVLGLLAVRDRPEQELPQVRRLVRLKRNDHVGVGRDRVGERELLRRVDDRELIRTGRRLDVAHRGREDALGSRRRELPVAVLHCEVAEVVLERERDVGIADRAFRLCDEGRYAG